MSDMPETFRSKAPLFEPIIPAVELDFPPHGGRASTHRILHDPCRSHKVELLDVEGLTHPLAGAQDAPYQIFRAIPKGPAPADGWPVLYMLDGNAAFDFLSADLLASAPGLVLIGIGQRTQQQFDRSARARDLIFPDTEAGTDTVRIGAPDSAGAQPQPLHGAPDFVPLLLNGLRQQAEAGLAINPEKRTLWGHSIAGLFVLRLMMAHPASFARFAAISPSLWHNPEQFGRALESALVGTLDAADGNQPTRPRIPLYLASGNREKRTKSAGPVPTDAPAAYHALVAQLGQTAGVAVSHQVYDGAIHIASLPTSLAPVLRFATI